MHPRDHADGGGELGHQLLACAPRLRGFARRLLGQDAEDGLQEALAAACRSLPGFRGEAQLSTWFHRLAVRTLCAFRARRTARNTVETTDGDAAMHLSPAALRAYAATPLESLAEQERRDRVQRALDRLRPAHREVLLLRGEGLDYAAIAEVLDVPLGTVKSRMHTALVALAERLPDPEELLP
ncbi:MAG: RNA polymerase sigma factor [Planctomycetota bacterium]|nr:RNA polymerase sigma factor [Planctomycetota bacterium]